MVVLARKSLDKLALPRLLQTRSKRVYGDADIYESGTQIRIFNLSRLCSLWLRDVDTK